MNLRILLLLACICMCTLSLRAQNKLEFFAGGNLNALSFSTDARHNGGRYYGYRIKSYGIMGSGGFQAGLRRQFTLPESRVWFSAGLAYSRQRQVIYLSERIPSIEELDMSFADRLDNLAFPLRAGISLGELSLNGGLTAYYTLARKFTETEGNEENVVLHFNDSKQAFFLENTADVNRLRAALALSIGYQLPRLPRLGLELQYEKYLTPFWHSTVLGNTRTGSNVQLNLSYALRQASEEGAAGEYASNIRLITGLGIQPKANLSKYPAAAKNYVSGIIGVSRQWAWGKGVLETGIQYQERKFVQRGPGQAINLGMSGNMRVTLTKNLQTQIRYISVPLMYRYPLAEKVAGKLGLSMHTAVRRTKTYETNSAQTLSLYPALTAGLSYQLNPTLALAFVADQFIRNLKLDDGHRQFPLQLALQTEISL